MDFGVLRLQNEIPAFILMSSEWKREPCCPSRIRDGAGAAGPFPPLAPSRGRTNALRTTIDGLRIHRPRGEGVGTHGESLPATLCIQNVDNVRGTKLDWGLSRGTGIEWAHTTHIFTICLASKVDTRTLVGFCAKAEMANENCGKFR